MEEDDTGRTDCVGVVRKGSCYLAVKYQEGRQAISGQYLNAL